MFVNKDNALEPAYYHRQYENDFPKKEAEEPLFKRLSLIALPFFAIYAPLGKVISLGMSGLRTFSSLSGFSKAYQASSVSDLRNAGIEVFLSAAALGAFVFANPAGILITTGHDILINGKEGAVSLYAGNYKEALSSAGQMANSSLYLVMLSTNSIAIVALSIGAQVAVEGYKSMDEFNEGRNLEAFAHLAMAGIRSAQFQQLVEIEPYKKSATQIEKTEKSSDVPYFDQIMGAIREVWDYDFKKLEALQNDPQWQELSSEQLQKIADKAIGKSRYRSRISGFWIKNDEPRFVSLFKAVTIDHPKADFSEAALMGNLRSTISNREERMVQILKEHHPKYPNLSSEQLLELLGTLKTSGGLGSGDRIFQILSIHKNWGTTPTFIKGMLENFTGLPVSLDIKLKAIHEIEKTESWKFLDAEILSKIIIEYQNSSNELLDIFFDMAQRHPEYLKISSGKLLEFIRTLKPTLIERLSTHPNWKQITNKEWLEVFPFIFEKMERAFYEKLPFWDSVNRKSFFELFESFGIDLDFLDFLSHLKIWKQLNQTDLAYMKGYLKGMLFFDDHEWQKILSR